jgi:hypothetical protein
MSDTAPPALVSAECEKFRRLMRVLKEGRHSTQGEYYVREEPAVPVNKRHDRRVGRFLLNAP